MKGKSPLLVSLLALLVVGWHSCSYDWDRETISPDASLFPLDQIKRAFARDYVGTPRTRVGSMSDSTQFLDPGYIRPQWDSVLVYRGENLFQAATAFDAEYDYCVLRWDENDSLMYAMPKRVVVLKDPETEMTASYLRFLIPDADYVCTEDGADYTGFVLYTTLSGDPVTVGRYDGGILSDSASVWDNPDISSESVERMSEAMDGLFVARVSSTANPQDPGKPQDPSHPIDPVEIIGKKPPKIVNVYSLLDDLLDWGGFNPPGIKPPLDDIIIDFGGGGGGSGGTGNEGDRSYASKRFPANPKIKFDKEEVRNILDLLNEDCMGQVLINAMRNDVSIKTGYNSSGVRANILRLPSGPIITDYEVLIADYQLTPITIMEELMHIYQGIGKKSFRQAAMNYEVEAKLGWYMFCERNGIEYNFGPALGGDEGVNQFRIMKAFFLDNDVNNPAFIEAFDNAVGALRSINAYSNEERYPYDPGKMECKKLIELMINCLN